MNQLVLVSGNYDSTNTMTKRQKNMQQLTEIYRSH